ncbi:unnamed protein product [Owenia fusiformis]|uniref:Uncharacterized protein n=1 Tax=Owenia fusiformis TaxID=6347 RepID=A0A8J1TZE4_OWEFU|nr:unnamed protein product [Owenia fusiformis]
MSSSIRPSQGLILDGSGHEITLTGEAIELNGKSIVHRINFDTGPKDALRLSGGDANSWVHRCSFRNYGDGLLDITKGYSHVTVSNCKFKDHDKTMLIGANKNDVDDRNMRVTIHHNFFNNCHQRTPRVRYATVHVYNNVFKNWGSYAVGSSQRGKVLVENNYFQTSERSRAAEAHTTVARGDDTRNGYLRAEGNYYNTGISGKTNQPDRVENMSYQYQLDTANDDLKTAVIAGAGYKS